METISHENENAKLQQKILLEELKWKEKMNGMYINMFFNIFKNIVI